MTTPATNAELFYFSEGFAKGQFSALSKEVALSLIARIEADAETLHKVRELAERWKEESAVQDDERYAGDGPRTMSECAAELRKALDGDK